MLELAMARRNLLRNPLRSAFALTAIIFGIVALVLSGGFIDWVLFAMRRDTIHSRLGHIQIAKRGYFSQGIAAPFSFILPEKSREISLIENTAHVRVLTPRLSFEGLASHDGNTVSLLGEGVDPDRELAVSTYVLVDKGKGLSSEDPKGFIVGEGLAANLGVAVGDRIILLANTSSGGINAVEGHVRGIFHTLSKAYDNVAIRLPITTARNLVRVSGSHAWVLLLDKTENTGTVLDHLRDQLKPDGEFEIKPWTELADFYNKTARLFSRQMDLIRLIIGFIIVLSISNTLTMSVLERTSEIGTMMAMGARRQRILSLFVSEGLILGAVGGVAGMAVGYVLAEILSAIGIPMPPPPGMERGYTGEILWTQELATKAYVLALATAVLGSLYPAWKASRMRIVDALRFHR